MMSRQSHNGWVALSPPFAERSASRVAFREHAAKLVTLLTEGDIEDDASVFDRALTETLDAVEPSENSAALRAALSVLTDIASQRWLVRVTTAGEVEVRCPEGERLDPKREKARIRAQELIKRNQQLREPATRKFIEGMERRTLHKNELVSVYDLLRDGRELATTLREFRKIPKPERAIALLKVVDPYLQFVDEADRCPESGLRLQDIWRYFRHTWTNQYTSTPGRSMAFLVRDRSQRYHPVIGIGALGSPIVQIRERDAWIGWHPDAFMERVSESPSAALGVWLNKTVDTAVGDLYLADLVAEEVVSPADIRSPSIEVVDRLMEHGEKRRQLHHRLANSREFKGSLKRGEDGNDSHWRRRALTHLYKSKRAITLAEMLRSRLVLQRYLSDPPKVEEVRQLLASSDGRRVVKTVLRKAKADRVGIAMADIIVCGAVPPYSPLLGGKLVAMLAASPEVVDAYRRKYVQQESEIASSMAGRPVVRPSELVFLGTTSLYGIGSSQYNRLRMPAERLGGRPGERLDYIEIGKSEAYGTSHFSTETVEALVALVQQSSNGQRVNSIFGEGVSPKLRKIRDGLDLLNFPADVLLQHGRRRIVYGVPLVRNLREFLLGMDDVPDYICDAVEPACRTQDIARWWAERWLSKRIESDDVLSQAEQHTLVRPIRHGARVLLPKRPDEQAPLFEDVFY